MPITHQEFINRRMKEFRSDDRFRDAPESKLQEMAEYLWNQFGGKPTWRDVTSGTYERAVKRTSKDVMSFVGGSRHG